jgi:amidohydrolase
MIPFQPTAGTNSTCTTPLNLPADIIQLRPEIVDNRRYFHAHPEIAFCEKNTAAKIVTILRSYGIEKIWEQVGKTGVVAVIEGGAGSGPCIALRADMDALPLPETADIPYKSVNNGIMHACGHDGHMASLLAAARILHARRATLKGSVRLIFQPAEEGLGGAREMLKDGVLTEKYGGVNVDECYGIHLWSYMATGTVSVTNGPFMAASDKFDIRVYGKGGHGAQPQGTVDAIIEAAHLVTALQTIISRNRDPLDPAVVTIGKISGGHNYNIICDEVEISGTARSFTVETQELVKKRMLEICDGVAATFGGKIDLKYSYGYPCTDNKYPGPVSLVRNIASGIVGEERCKHEAKTCGAEDFSYFLQQVPGAFFFVGAALPGEVRPHHKSIFDFDEDSLLVSAALFVGIIERILGSN